MSAVFNVDDVFEIAEQIERNGAQFYRRAASAVGDEAVRGIFEELARAEERHEQTFARIRADLTLRGWQPETWDPDGLGARYLRATASGHVFRLDADIDALAAGVRSEKDALRMAMGFEKDSIIYYLGMKEAVPAELGGDHIERIIGQEMRHIGILARELARRTS